MAELTLISQLDTDLDCFTSPRSVSYSSRLSLAADRGSEADVEAMFSKLLETKKLFKSIKFDLYKLEKIDNKYQLNRIFTDVKTYPENESYFDNSLNEVFIDWLIGRKSRLKYNKSKTNFFSNSVPEIKEPREVTENNENACDVILGLASHIAPCPQKLGLSRTLLLNPGDVVEDVTPENVVAIPRFIEMDEAHIELDDIVYPDNPGGESISEGGQIRIPYPNNDSNIKWCIATVSSETSKQNTAINPADGLIEASVTDSELLHATLERIEQRTGSLYTGYLASCDIDWTGNRVGRSGESHDKLDVIKRLSWQAVMRISTSLDTILMAILMPGREIRDGELLSPFLNILSDKFEQHKINYQKKRLDGVFRKNLREAIRKSIRDQKNIVLIGAIKDEQKSLFVKALQYLCDIPLQQDENKSDLISSLMCFYKLNSDDGKCSIEKKILSILDAEEHPDQLRTTDNETPASLLTVTNKGVLVLTQVLDQELSVLNDNVCSENGTEATIIRLLRYETIRDGFASLISAGADPQTGEDPEASAGIIYDESVMLLEKAFQQGINGAEAARQSVSSLLSDLAILDTASVDEYDDYVFKNSTNSRDVEKTIKDGHFWSLRFNRCEDKGSICSSAHTKHLGKIVSSLSEICAIAHPFKDEHENGYFKDDNFAIDVIEHSIGAMTSSAFEELFPEQRRYSPDTSPKPLTIRVTVDPNTQDEDDPRAFEESYSGVAMLLRRHTGEQGKWAHANLAELSYKPINGELTKISGITTWPLPTTIVDGRRNLFLTYSGVPFSSSAYDDAMNLTDKEDAPKPLITSDYPTKTILDNDKYEPCYPLAYGYSYDTAAHVTSRSGSLPKLLQSSTETPWLPKNDLKNVIDDKYFQKFDCSRTTAIGRIDFADEGAEKGNVSNLKPRIGIAPKGMRPLSSDYPRTGLSSGYGLFLDLFRNTDGTGAISLPAEIIDPVDQNSSSIDISLGDIKVYKQSTSKAILKIQLLSIPNFSADDKADLHNIDESSNYIKFKLTDSYPGDLTVKVGRDEQNDLTLLGELGNKVSDETKLQFNNSSIWIRLTLESPITGNVPSSISLPDPTLDSTDDAASAREIPDNLLLIGFNAKDHDNWRESYGKPAIIKIALPRMSYADFMRWTSNERLCINLFDTKSSTVKGGGVALIKKFRQVLQVADISRHGNPLIALYLDRLPDLAVDAVQLRAIQLDSISKASPEMATVNTRDINPGYLGDFLQKNNNLIDSILSMPNDKQETREKTGDNLIELLSKIDSHYQHSLTVNTSSEKTGFDKEMDSFSSTSALNVAAGESVRLIARPVVSRSHFEPAARGLASVMDKRLLQWAVNSDSKKAFFDGPNLIIESMLPNIEETKSETGQWLKKKIDWTREVYGLLDHEPAGNARQYRIKLNDSKLSKSGYREWRLIDNIDVATQRWRFTGRPIYDWIAPAKNAYSYNEDSASIHLDPLTDSDAFDKFEGQLFFKRDDADSLTESISVNPLGTETTLVEMEWDKPSATMFRHRFTLGSRYRHAMRDRSRGEVNAWPDSSFKLIEDVRKYSWCRIVMLGERSRLHLTRPQLRTLIPLTQSTDDYSLTPPLLAMLSERPFAHGELAERITAEISTGVGYELSTGEDSKVLPADIRKEYGKDGRLDYSAVNESAAYRTVLAQEGPAGLTFDRPDSSAPAFPNCSYMLHPSEITDNGEIISIDARENFLDVRFLRYLDPDWLQSDDVFSKGIDTGDIIDFNQVTWIELKLEESKLPAILLKNNAGEDLQFLSTMFCSSSKRVAINIHPLVLDQEVATASDENKVPTPLCTVPSEGGSIILLHTPDEDGHATLTVLYKQDNTGNKQSATDEKSENQPYTSGNAPVAVASISWQVPEGYDSKYLLLENIEPGGISLTSASMTGAFNWTRTNTDFTRVRLDHDQGLHYEKVSSTEGHIHVHDLIFRFRLMHNSGNDESVQTWARSEQSTQNWPTHTQRHMAALFTHTLSGLGRDIEVPQCAHSISMKDTPLTLKNIDCIDHMRFIEYEVPAEIFVACANSDRFPDRYTRAFFDLFATGMEKCEHMSLHMRLIGATSTLEELNSLKFHLTPDSEKNVIKFEVSHNESTSIQSIILDIDIVANKISATGISLDGGCIKMTVTRLEKPAFPLGGMRNIELSCKKTAAEVWLETSLLASNKDKHGFLGSIDFNWFFGDETKELEQAGSIESIRAMKEAQARIISVSNSTACHQSDSATFLSETELTEKNST